MKAKDVRIDFAKSFRILAIGLVLLLLSASAVVVCVSLLSHQAAQTKNPTYFEVVRFVSGDSTDKNKYVDGLYTCYNFALDFRLRAQTAGYTCGFVVLYFPSGRSHSLNCFNTTDRGLIFIEPQTDDVVSMIIGEPYWGGRRLERPIGYDDTIKEFLILW